MVRDHFWKNVFLTHFGLIFCPKTAYFQGILGFSMRQNAPPRGIFFAPGTTVDPSLAPNVCGLCYPPAPSSDHWYRGLGVSLGDSEAWKPQEVGGCGWTRCPRNSVLSHVAQDTARSWFRACLTQATHIQAIFGHFWAVPRTYR